jgi:WD40 repeat protein
MVWSPDGTSLAACSAAGEIVIQSFRADVSASLEILDCSTAPIDTLAFSADGKFLAAGNQSGQVQIWVLEGHRFVLLMTHTRKGCWIEHLCWHPTQPLVAFNFVLLMTHTRKGCWIEHLCWHPTQPLVAFNVGHTTEVLNVATQSLVAKLDFENSSVLCLTWHPSNGQLMVGGYQGLKIWNSHNWKENPLVLELASASLAIAWAPDGRYLALGNLDRTITVLEWRDNEPNPKPWVMSGFPGKVRHLVWSPLLLTHANSLLASASVEGVVIWERSINPLIGWEGRLLENHSQAVEAIAFQPQTKNLASAGADGLVSLWHDAKRLAHTLTDARQGFSCLCWHPQGQSLAAGGRQGELFIWSQTQSGKGFGNA